MKNTRRPLAGTLIVLVTILLAIGFGGTAFWGRFMAQPGPLVAEAQVHIPTGSSVTSIASALQGAGVITNPLMFKIATKAMGLGSTLKAGEYTFEPRISLRATINKMATGETKLRMVTIPEGWTVAQATAYLSQEDLGLLGNAPIPAEGTLFPDTYAFNLGTKRDKILGTIQARAEKELMMAWEARTAHPALNDPQQMLILASIVQKEAANEAEMPEVAAVFLNRLTKNMRLQADATIIYGKQLASQYDGNIRKADLTDDTNPYNTYTHNGLPPSPISNPGRAALMAVARPATSANLFFVADPSLTHHLFAETYEQHQQNVRTFLKGLPK